MKKDIQKQKIRKKKLVSKLGELSEIIEGSFFSRELNGRVRCYLSRMQGNRQRQYYVRGTDADAVRAGNEQYRELLETVRELSEINLKLIKEG